MSTDQIPHYTDASADEDVVYCFEEEHEDDAVNIPAEKHVYLFPDFFQGCEPFDRRLVKMVETPRSDKALIDGYCKWRILRTFS